VAGRETKHERSFSAKFENVSRFTIRVYEMVINKVQIQLYLIYLCCTSIRLRHSSLVNRRTRLYRTAQNYLFTAFYA
jgi:hypothetical protein